MPSPEVALCLSTYQRPGNLRRSLASIAAQWEVRGRFELVVTDDGSTDETADVVAGFAREVDFPVRFMTHRHEAFQLARCRNEGVAASSAPYLLFVDGDCVLPPDYVAQHLARRRAGAVMAGASCYLDPETSARVTVAKVRTGDYLLWIPAGQRKHLTAKAVRAQIYNLLRHPTLPRLSGGNVAIWRRDYQRVNGYDEHFVGWGNEDRDLQFRLSRTGVRFVSSMSWAVTRHLWHPPDPTFIRNGLGTPNLRYLRRPGRLIRCRNGLQKRRLEEIKIRVIGAADHGARGEALLKGRFVGAVDSAEVEILFAPGRFGFSGKADCNLLVQFGPDPAAARQRHKAHIVVTDAPTDSGPDAVPRFRLNQFEQALDAIV